MNSKTSSSYVCSCCGKKKSIKSHFIQNGSFLYEKNNGYMTICKSCLNDYFEGLLIKKKLSPYSAFRAVCCISNTYYNNEVVDSLISSPKMKTTFGDYIRLINLNQYKTKTYIDTILEDESLRVQDMKVKQAIEKVGLNDYTKAEMQQQELLNEIGDIEDIYEMYMKDKNLPIFWGAGYSKEEYIILEGNYQDYISQYECKSKVEEELFKSLCQLTLEADKARNLGEFKRYQDLTKLWQDTIGSANIKPSQSKIDELSDKQVYGMLIKKFEDTRPVSKQSKKFADIDKIKKYLRIWFFGCLANTLNIKNQYYDEFVEEMEKHTVYPPQENFNESENTTNEVLDNLF